MLYSWKYWMKEDNDGVLWLSQINLQFAWLALQRCSSTFWRVYSLMSFILVILYNKAFLPFFCSKVAQFLLDTAEVKKPVLYYQSSEFARKVAEQKYVDPTGEKAIKLYEAGVLSLVK